LENGVKSKRTRPEAQEEARLIHIRLNPETHKRLRVRTAEEDVSIQDWVEALLERELNLMETDNSRRSSRG
jgi:predicted HicB family RNase H-like nuclease